MPDPGANWSEVSGDWEILNNELHEKAGGGGTVGAKLIGTQPIPARSAGEMRVQCKFVDALEGQIYVLYAAANSTGTSYFKSTHEKLTDTTWRTTIYKQDTAYDSVVQTFTPYPDANHVGGWICVDREGNVKAGVVSLDAYAWEEDLGGLTGRYYGVGHENDEDTYFDDFQVEELRTATEICDACWCPCCLIFPGKTLNIAITGATNQCCSCLNGSNTTLTWEWDSGLQPWKGLGSWGGGPNTWTFRLECSSDSDPGCTGQNWQLTVITQCGSYAGTLCANLGDCTMHPNAEFSTCDPFSLVFGPFTISRGMLGCAACKTPPCDEDGIYYLTVTPT